MAGKTPTLDSLSDAVDAIREQGSVDVGCGDRQCVSSRGRVKLYSYDCDDAVDSIKTPLLIVYALVNRPYILDLQADKSLIALLSNKGVQVFLIDWGYPNQSDFDENLECYVEGYIDGFVDDILQLKQIKQLNLLGICQGGTLSTCYAALHAEKVKNLITMVTPVDFHTSDNLLGHWVRYVDMDLMIGALGNVPGESLKNIFTALQPYNLTIKKYLDMLDQVGNSDNDLEWLKGFIAMEQWINDVPDQAGTMFREFVKKFYQRNELFNGELWIADNQVNTKNIVMPILNIIATKDHIVPPSSSRALELITNSCDYAEQSVPTGHIGVFMSRSALKVVPEMIERQLRKFN